MKDDHDDLRNKAAEYFGERERHEFVKHDNGKLQWSLVPWDALALVADVIQYGATKYFRDSWRQAKAEDLTRWEDAMLRHYVRWKCGDALDQESRKHHLAHLACNALFLVWHHCCRKTPCE